MGPGWPGPCSRPRGFLPLVRREPTRPSCPRGSSLSPTLPHGRSFGATLGSAPRDPAASHFRLARWRGLLRGPNPAGSPAARRGSPQLRSGPAGGWTAGCGETRTRYRHRPQLSQRHGLNPSPVPRGPSAGRPLAGSPFTTRERPFERQFLRAEQAKIDAGMSEPSGWAQSGKVGGRRESGRAVGLTAGTQCYEITYFSPPPPWISFPLPLTPA